MAAEVGTVVPRTTATPALSGATRLFRAPAARYLTVPVGFLLIFFFLPLILIVLVSFTSSFPSASITLTTSNYVQFFGSSLYRAYLLTTIVYGLEVTVLCLLMGYPLAYYMVRQRGLVYQITLLAVIAPLLVGVVPRTVGWIAVLGTEGVINNILLGLHLSRRPLTLLYNPTAAVVGLAHVLLPFMVLSIASVLSLIDRSLREAAQNLGAGELQIFRRITIPLSLHGVAVGVKDMIDVAGLPTRCGSTLRAGALPAPADAAVVSTLRAAGAVVVGKLHTHEFAYGPTGDVAATGPCRNPHDPARITGGSSSGSAAAVAAGHLPLALGTDTGCSVRVPAALCGVVGLKPAFGALPTDGVFPLSESCDHVGVLATDVHTASVAWDVLARGPQGSGGGIQPPGLDGVLVGLPDDEHWQPYDPAIAAAVATAAAALEARGARLMPVSIPQATELALLYPRVVGPEAYATHARWLAQRPGDYQPRTAERLLDAAGATAEDYVGAQRRRHRLVAELRARLAPVDVLLTPTAPLRATVIGEQQVGGRSVAAALLSLCCPFNLAGWPAVSVPGQVPDGELPAGLQVVGVRFGERGVLRVAAALHATTDAAPGPGSRSAGRPRQPTRPPRSTPC